MTVQLSGNTAMPAAYPGVRMSADATVENALLAGSTDLAAGLAVFTDAGGTAGTVEVMASGNVPASKAEIRGVSEYLPGKTASGAAGEQYAYGDQVSIVKNGQVMV